MKSPLCLLVAAALAMAADVDVTGKWEGTLKRLRLKDNHLGRWGLPNQLIIKTW